MENGLGITEDEVESFHLHPPEGCAQSGVDLALCGFCGVVAAASVCHLRPPLLVGLSLLCCVQ